MTLYTYPQVPVGTTLADLAVATLAQANADIAAVMQVLMPMANGHAPSGLTAYQIGQQAGISHMRAQAAASVLNGLGVARFWTKAGNGGGQFYAWTGHVLSEQAVAS